MARIINLIIALKMKHYFFCTVCQRRRLITCMLVWLICSPQTCKNLKVLTETQGKKSSFWRKYILAFPPKVIKSRNFKDMTIFKFLIKYSIFNLICLFTSNSSHLMGYIGKNVSVCVCVYAHYICIYIYIFTVCI